MIMIRKSFRYSLLSLFSLALCQLPSFAYQVDSTAHTVTVSPGTTPSANTTELRNAFNYLVNRTDKDTQWTPKLNPGKYTTSAQITVSGLQNTIVTSADASNPAKLVKMDGWDSATSAEYLLYFRLGKKVQLLNMEFYGQTSFANGPNPYWPDQGVYFGSCDTVKVEGDKFYNFGNTALRVVTDNRDPVPGVDSFRTYVNKNTFNNIYQTATTSIDSVHGGTALSTWSNNTYVNLRGSVKFASRTPGAQHIEFLSNTINGSDHYGLEIDNYNDFKIQNNTLQNIKEYAMTIYTNGSGDLMKSGFPWGDDFIISGNNITNVGSGIRFDHRAFWDGSQNIPKNLVIDNNTISQVTTTASYVPVITVTGGVVDGLQVTNNKMSAIANKKYLSILSGCTNVTNSGNTADGVTLK
jgi:hypothetical protein